MDNTSYTIRVPKRWARLSLVVVVTALIVAPLTAVATHMGFTDVPDTNTHHNDIAWLKDADVTKGCNPPANDNYCPSDFVTRAQMATFMRNLATNQVVDAATAQTASTALEVSNDVPGVALAGVSAIGTVVNNWFNRYGGQPTIANPATGAFVVTFPGLEGRLGWTAIVSATISSGNCLIRQFGGVNNNAVELRTYAIATGTLTSGCGFDVVVNAANDVSGASTAGQPSPDQLEESGG